MTLALATTKNEKNAGIEFLLILLDIFCNMSCSKFDRKTLNL